jgi:hypothetical protein
MIVYVIIVLLKVEKSSYVESILYICCRGCCGAISDELVQQRKVWSFWCWRFHNLGYIWVRLPIPSYKGMLNLKMTFHDLDCFTFS